MRAILVSVDWCQHCEKAKERLSGIIDKGYLSVMNIDDALNQYGEIPCMSSGDNYRVPTVVLVDDSKIVSCMPASSSEEIIKALLRG